MATLRMSLAYSTGKPGTGVVRGQWLVVSSWWSVAGGQRLVPNLANTFLPLGAEFRSLYFRMSD
jgi:hypothetical protein